jgi:MFS family permease
MSTLGSEFNTLSGILTHDFYKKKIKPELSEKNEVIFGRLATIIIGAITILLAVLLSFLRGLTLMDIMFRFFAAFAPPIMIPLILGLLFKKFNARGVIWGVIAGATTGIILILINFILMDMYADQLASNPRLEFWLRSGWNSAATVLNIIATILGMWIGTAMNPTSGEEEKKVNDFFKDLNRPYELDVTAAKSSLSPFRIIGFTLAIFGLVIILISFILLMPAYYNVRAFRLDLILGLTLMILGGIMWVKSRMNTKITEHEQH